MKQLIFTLLILTILIIGCGKQSFTSVMPPIEKQEEPIQSGCSVEGLEKQVSVEYIKTMEEL